MNITLSIDKSHHQIISYGKSKIPILHAPYSILRRIVYANCFTVIQSDVSNKAIPSICLSKDYLSYAESASKRGQDATTYQLVLCTRKNELLQYYSKKYGQKLMTLEALLLFLSEEYPGYYFGANYGPSGIQLTIADGALLSRDEHVEGKKLFFPFLIKEFERELEHLVKYEV